MEASSNGASKRSAALTGYALMKQFRKLRSRHAFSSLEADLFYELVGICNEEDWPEEFHVSNPLLCGTLGCVESSLWRARKRLEEAGLIAFISGHKRAPTRYRLLKIPLHKEGVSANLSQIPLHKEGETEEETANPLYKEQTKTKTNTARRAASENSAVKNDVAFEQFWDAYGKKVDREKCEKRWAKLTPAVRLEAFAKVPAYVASKPELQYRKNPFSWLNGKCWQDEEVPSIKTPAAGFSATPTPAPRPVAAPVLDPEAVAANYARQQDALQQRIDARKQRQATQATQAAQEPAKPTNTP